MTAKEYLQQIYKINRRIVRLKQQRDALRVSMHEVGPQDGDRILEARTDDAMFQAIAKAQDKDRDMAGEINALIDAMDRIAGQIDLVEDERYRTILHERYVCCYKWPRIAEDMQMDLRYIYRLHGHALQAFWKIIKEDIVLPL